GGAPQARATSAESTLSDDETADAPAAGEEDEADVAPAPRDLGPEPTTMEELLAEQDSDIKSFKHGDVVEGTVVRIDKDEILVDNRKANRLILSEKVALYEERREKRDELFSSLQVGQKVNGTVRSIAPFGVFIDLGGIDGLVHKSELSWNKVNNPESGYKVG